MRSSKFEEELFDCDAVAYDCLCGDYGLNMLESTPAGDAPMDVSTSSGAVSTTAAAAEVRAAVGDGRGALPVFGSLGVEAAKLVNLKDLAKPMPFDGSEANWRDWRFRFENVCTLLGFLDQMQEATRHAGVELEALELDYVEAARVLYSILVCVCGGKALSLVRSLPQGSGFRAWKLLVEEYEPVVAARRAAVLSELLTPRWTDANFIVQWYRWERELRQYEVTLGVVIPSDIKCAILARHAPNRVKEFLRLSATDVTTNYEELRGAIRSFFLCLLYTSPSPRD